MHSLRGKIILVYLTLAVLAVGLSLLALLELRLLANKVQAGSTVAEFFDASLELRRFEKNLFLYGQPADLRENARYSERALELLRREGDSFAGLVDPDVVRGLEADLVEYIGLMRESVDRPGDDAFADRIRAVGKRIVTAGEALAQLERRNLRLALAAHQRNLMFSVAAVALLLAGAGFVLARWVTRPLQAMQARMEVIAAGQLSRLDLDPRERELASLSQAFNHVLDELERRQHTLVRSEKLASLGTLLSGVAHELNNPLSNISTTAQILNEDDLDAEVRRELLTDIDRETRRAATIVRSLLDYAADRHFEPKPVELAVLIEETLRFLKNLRAPGIEISLAIQPGLAVTADRARLQQALLNLLKNALQAMGDYGELRIAAAPAAVASSPLGAPVLAGRCPSDAAAVDLVIDDSGPGIPAEQLSRVFDPFFTTKPVGQGSGLGLFISQEIIDQHGGCIGVENRIEGGARFRIRLPAANLLPVQSAIQPETRAA